MTAAALASTILTFTAIVGVGVILRAAGVLRREDARPINAVIIYAGLPAFIFRAVEGASLRSDLWVVVAVAWVVFVAVALLGAKELPEAIFYDVFGTVGALVLVGLLVAQRFGDNDEARVNPLRELLTFPAVWALAAALLLRNVPIPDVVGNGLGLLASMVAPLIMLSVGLSLRASSMGRSAVPLLVHGVLRLIVAPALALGIGLLVLGPGLPLRVTVLEAGMPAMMLTLVVGERFGLDSDFIASAILVTTALSAATLPLMQLVAFR